MLTMINNLKAAWPVLIGAALLDPARASATVLGAAEWTGEYTSWGRILAIVIVFLIWLLFCQWVGQDTTTIRKLNQPLWQGVVLGGGFLGLATLLLAPWNTPQLLWAGFGLWVVLILSTTCIYVVVRNGYVEPAARVGTKEHLARWMKNVGKKKEEKMDAVERVRMVAHDGAKVACPSDKDGIEAFEIVQDLMFDALWRRATEVVLILTAQEPRLLYRIDGVVTPRADLLDKEQAEKVIPFIKKHSGLDVDEHRRPQVGTILAGITGGNYRGTTEIEVKTSGTTQEERLRMQIIGDQNRLRINDLGMTEPQRELFEKTAGDMAGLTVVSGPHGSGLTTTLYAALRTHDSFMQNILTLERQPLMDLENITQHVYDATKHEASYARQLQTVLRREPDVVMSSDCVDRETAHLAVKAACESKKMYLGIQARDTFEALKKLVSLAGDMEGVADALQIVTCQRLVRKLCVACRIPYRPDKQLLKKANLPVDKIDHFYRAPKAEDLVDEKGRAKGVCPNCQGSGYFGRTGVFEILEINEPIRELIRKGQSLNAIRAQARKNGMLYLQEVGLQKVIEGITSMNEMLRALRDEEPTAAA
ncbi:MAG: Flp pilus assembly complex ATPase component TadA [Phycisphaerales bacterium]|nr:Flp pilus assembly complex ATPase component TadA [Phycisphaerales bacterium]